MCSIPQKKPDAFLPEYTCASVGATLGYDFEECDFESVLRTGSGIIIGSFFFIVDLMIICMEVLVRLLEIGMSIVLVDGDG